MKSLVHKPSRIRSYKIEHAITNLECKEKKFFFIFLNENFQFSIMTHFKSRIEK